MVEVLDQQQRVVLALLVLQRADPVGVEYGKDDGADENDDQAGKGKIFDQTKRFGSLCDGGRFHGLLVAAPLAGRLVYRCIQAPQI